jgi:cytoskeletal protein RodZ
MTTAGQKLKAARLEKNLTLEDISKATKIKSSFLEYIENGEYQKLPSVSYAHGFVKNYASFLGLDEKELLAVFRREYKFEKTERVLPKGFGTEQDFSNSKLRINSTFVVIAAVFVLFFGFILFQYRTAFLNPSLTIMSPKNNAVIYSTEVTIQGKTDPDTTVYVDKNEVSVDATGNFTKTVDVFPGTTAVIIKSINKFQRVTQKTISLNIKSQ